MFPIESSLKDQTKDEKRQDKKDDIKETARINDISIQRGIIDFNVSDYDNSSINNSY